MGTIAMKDETNSIKIHTADTYLLTQVKYLLRNFIGYGDRFTFEDTEEWHLNITAMAIDSNIINALSPLIKKHNLIWLVTVKSLIDSSDVLMILFKPKKAI
jgi:hypothetical protein